MLGVAQGFAMFVVVAAFAGVLGGVLGKAWSKRGTAAI
jgi:hypothetical protein